VGPSLSELKVAGLTLRGVTVGGIMTCLMCPEIGVMFDVGPQLPGQMKYDTILVSHGHQDHLGGLPYLVSQRKMHKTTPLRVHLPQEVQAPLRTIIEAWSQIEDFQLEVDLQGHMPGATVELAKSHRATAVRSVHRVPSLAWIVERVSRRLRPEYAERAGEDLAQLRRDGVEITEPHVEPVLCVTGDTQIELFVDRPEIRRARVLVHEVTGWDDRRNVEQVRKWGHTHVDELIEHVEKFEGDALVLVHRSPRHSRAQAERVVAERFPASVRERVHVFG
jgi:ribonuclease Z